MYRYKKTNIFFIRFKKISYQDALTIVGSTFDWNFSSKFILIIHLIYKGNVYQFFFLATLSQFWISVIFSWSIFEAINRLICLKLRWWYFSFMEDRSYIIVICKIELKRHLCRSKTYVPSYVWHHIHNFYIIYWRRLSGCCREDCERGCMAWPITVSEFEEVIWGGIL